MATLFPLSASVGQQFQDYAFDGETWNIIGENWKPFTYSATEPDYHEPGFIWVDSNEVVEEISYASASGYQILVNKVMDGDSNYFSNIPESATLPSQDGNSGKYLTTSGSVSSWGTIDALPSQSGNSGKYLTTSGSAASWGTLDLSPYLTQTSASTTYLSKNEASSTYLTSASMQTVPVYVINSGSSAQRPTSASVGMIRFNTTLDAVEAYHLEGWLNLSNKFQAIGGTEVLYSSGSVNYKAHIFTTSGNFTVNSGAKNVEFLLVAGGGGAGVRHSGGGGAGGLIVSTANVTTNVYSIVIGAGGARSGTSNGDSGNSGSNSSCFGFTAIGGGKGGTYADSGLTTSAASGGSGGGAPYGASLGSGTAGQGFAGGPATSGVHGGGGGGAAAAGTAGLTTNGGDGGSGVLNSYDNNSYYYAGGGGGSAWNSSGRGGNGGLGGSGGGGMGYDSGTGTAGLAGASGRNAGQNGSIGGSNGSNPQGGSAGANTGSGGGGSGQGAYLSWAGTGGAGGSGIVIVRYQV